MVKARGTQRKQCSQTPDRGAFYTSVRCRSNSGEEEMRGRKRVTHYGSRGGYMRKKMGIKGQGKWGRSGVAGEKNRWILV